jgi:hypothetical protein
MAVLAVADGAGSAPFSRTGAEFAVDRAVRYLRNVADLVSEPSVWASGVRGAISAARGRIFDYARSQGLDAQQFATTLQVVLLGQAGCCYGRVGDGGGVGRLAGALVPLAPAPDNDYVNETHFLTSLNCRPEVFFHPGPMSDCAIFTDGIQHLAMHLAQWTPHDPFFSPLFDFVRGQADTHAAQARLGAYLETDRFERRTDDDRALVISVWTGDAA